MSSLKSRLRRANNNRRYNKTARTILAGIHRQPTREQIKQCNDYAGDVLGSVGYAPWLHIYAAVAGEFREGWIPDNYFKQYVVWPSSYENVSGHRPLGAKFFPDAPIPDIAHVVDGNLFLKDNTPVPKAQWADAVFAHDARLIYKTDSSLQGLGIAFLDKAAFVAAAENGLANGVLQTVIKQHPMFDELSPNALATLRITTALDQHGQASARASYLRLGRATDTHIKSHTGLRAPVDLQDGTLSETGLLPDWNPFTQHPDTDASLSRQRIPNMAKIKEMLTGLHASVPFFPCIGWDIAIDEAGAAHILEWNGGHAEIKFTEATQGPAFADLGWTDRWRTDA